MKKKEIHNQSQKEKTTNVAVFQSSHDEQLKNPKPELSRARSQQQSEKKELCLLELLVRCLTRNWMSREQRGRQRRARSGRKAKTRKGCLTDIALVPDHLFFFHRAHQQHSAAQQKRKNERKREREKKNKHAKVWRELAGNVRLMWTVWRLGSSNNADIHILRAKRDVTWEEAVIAIIAIIATAIANSSNPKKKANTVLTTQKTHSSHQAPSGVFRHSLRIDWQLPLVLPLPPPKKDASWTGAARFKSIQIERKKESCCCFSPD